MNEFRVGTREDQLINIKHFYFDRKYSYCYLTTKVTLIPDYNTT